MTGLALRGIPLALLLAATRASAVGRASEPDADLGRMARLAAEFRVTDASADESLGVGERPLLRYSDPDRGIRTGTLWAWGRGGRPAAVAEVYQKFDEPGDWHVAFSSTGPTPVRGEFDGSRVWSPPADEPRLDPVGDVPPPSESADVRLRQMKAIARTFTGYEVFDPDLRRSQLRLLPNPLLRYGDPESDLIDGGMFVLAIGTNPEVLVFLEARREPAGTTWRYAAVRRGYAEMHLLRDGREVWRCDRLWETVPDGSTHEILTAAPDAATAP